MWPPICWMGNKYKEWSRLPSVDAESSRACLAFQQGFPCWEIEREKAFVSFFPFPDLTAPLSRVQRKRGHLAMKLWQLLSKRWSSINKLYFAFQGLLWPLLSGIEHLIARVVRNAAEQQILFFPIPSQGFFCCCCYVFFVLFFFFWLFNPWMPHKRLLGEVKGNETGVSSRYKHKGRISPGCGVLVLHVRDHLVHIFRKGWL